MSIKSELMKTASHLRSARNAILDCRGEISPTAGLKDLVSAIYTIPTPDVYLALRTDETTAYKKTVPDNAEQYALIGSIGGVTIKEADTFVVTVEEVDEMGTPTKISFTYTPSIPFMLPPHSEDGLWFFQAYFDYFGSVITLDQLEVYLDDDTSTVYGSYESLPTNVVIEKISGTLMDTSAMLYEIAVGTQWVCTPVFYDFGTTSMPDFLPPARLRDTKVTAIKSYKADGSLAATYLLPQAVIDAQTGKGVEGFTDTVDFENGKIIHRTKTIKLAEVEGWLMHNYGTGSLEGNKYIASNGMTTIYSTAVNDFLLSPVNQMLCDMLPNTTNWQGTILGVNLQKMNNGSHYINVNIPYQWAGLEATETAVTPKVVSWLKDNDATLTYALAKPIESELDTDFIPLIEVESGGYIEFVNEYGYAVPSKVTYLVLPQAMTPAMTLPTPTIELDGDTLNIVFDILVDGEVVATVPANEEE